MKSGAVFSDCRTYRYTLWRTWDEGKPQVAFIGLNPSTADEAQDDPTLLRCIGFARQWDYGSLVVVNLFAYRSAAPVDLKRAPYPVGDENDAWICSSTAGARLTIACWGNHGSHMQRDQAVRKLATNLYCLRITRQGQPAHPLYQPSRLLPIPYLTGSSS
jgi:hypothetical protein